MNFKSVLVPLLACIGLNAASVVKLDLYLAIKAYFAEDEMMSSLLSLEGLSKKGDAWYLAEEYCFLLKDSSPLLLTVENDPLRKCLLVMRHFLYLKTIQNEIGKKDIPKIEATFNSGSISESYANIFDVFEGTFVPQVNSLTVEIISKLETLFTKLEPIRVFSGPRDISQELRDTDQKIIEGLRQSLKKGQNKANTNGAEDAASIPLKSTVTGNPKGSANNNTIEEKDGKNEDLSGLIFLMKEKQSQKKPVEQSILKDTNNNNTNEQTLSPFPGDEEFFFEQYKNPQMHQILKERNENIWDYHRRFSKVLNEIAFAWQLLITPTRKDPTVLYNHIESVADALNTVIGSLNLLNIFSEPSKEAMSRLKSFGTGLHTWAQQNNGDKIPGFSGAINFIIKNRLAEELNFQVHEMSSEWLLAVRSSPLPEFGELPPHVPSMFMMALYFREPTFCDEKYTPIDLLKDYEEAAGRKDMKLLLNVKKRVAGLIEYAILHYNAL